MNDVAGVAVDQQSVGSTASCLGTPQRGWSPVLWTTFCPRRWPLSGAGQLPYSTDG